MTRDELILSCETIVENLVKKYNNHIVDEDLKSIGMIAVIECVDRCLSEEMSDENQIQARCNIWAKNRILNAIYSEKLKYVDDEFALDFCEAPNDIEYLHFVMSVAEDLTPKQLEIFNLLLEGKSQEEIEEMSNITTPTYYKHIGNIKKIIKSKV